MLTICSVSFNSEPYLALNYQLTKRLNQTEQFQWLVVNTNTSRPFDLSILKRGKFTRIPNDKRKWMGIAKGSYQHAAALNKALAYVKTRFLLIIDPDFFIIRKNWIREVLTYMQENKIFFFGAPYFPNRYTKYRYFPCAICMFIDLKNIKKDDLDFSPEIYEMNKLLTFQISALIGKLIDSITRKEEFKVRNHQRDLILKVLKIKFLDTYMPRKYKFLLSIGNTHDVGYRIFRRFYKKNRHVCIMPSWKNPLFHEKKSLINKDARLKSIIKKFLFPDKLNLYPKRNNYATLNSFREHGLPDISKKGWEEYFWDNKPFAFHIRGLFHGMQKIGFTKLSKILDNFKRAEV